MKKYQEDVSREFSLLDVKAWHKGESEELKKWIGFGFFNHIFVSENGIVTVYYDLEEIEKFDKIIEEKLTEDFFDELCDYFFELVGKCGNINSSEDAFEIYVKMWPAFTIFDELSKYPELGNDSMIRRLIRTRQTTQDFSFLSDKLKHPGLKDYIFYKGEIYFMPFEKFIKENNIEILK